jgi:DNA-binding IclR family transcriptional regulator
VRQRHLCYHTAHVATMWNRASTSGATELATDIEKSETQDAGLQQLTRSVAKALCILDCFTERTPRLTLAELSEQVDLAPTTLRRLASTLDTLGYLSRDDLGRYQLGVKAMSLAPAGLAAYDIRNVALPVLDMLSTQTGLNANLGILHDGRLVYLATVIRNLPRRRHFGVPGRLAAAHCNGLGKAMLAHLSPSEARSTLTKAGGLSARTPRTITSFDMLEAELAEVRERGYALDDEEAAIGGRCVAAPIRDRTGAVVAAISLSGMVDEINDTLIPGLADVLVRAAEEISFKLGYSFATEW